MSPSYPINPLDQNLQIKLLIQKNLNDDKEQSPKDSNIITETTDEVILEEDKRGGEGEEE